MFLVALPEWRALVSTARRFWDYGYALMKNTCCGHVFCFEGKVTTSGTLEKGCWSHLLLQVTWMSNVLWIYLYCSFSIHYANTCFCSIIWRSGMQEARNVGNILLSTLHAHVRYYWNVTFGNLVWNSWNGRETCIYDFILQHNGKILPHREYGHGEECYRFLFSNLIYTCVTTDVPNEEKVG